MKLNTERIKKYYYKVYGLNIESELSMPELLLRENDDNTQVIIAYGHMPKWVKEGIIKGESCRFEKNRMWFSVEDVGYFYISNGEYIMMEPDINAKIEDIKTFLLGSAFGMLLIQRQLVTIHGGSIEIDGHAMVFSGDSGSGKSTLTSAFRDKGYPFMADDVSVIGSGKDKVPIVYPAYPQQKLCKDTMIKMGYDLKKFIMIDDDREKYIVPILKHFTKEPRCLGAIFIIDIYEGENIKIEEIKGKEKISILLKNIYRIEIIKYSGLDSIYFRKCLDIAKNVPLFKVKRPKNKFSVDDEISAIENLIHKNNMLQGK